MDLIIVNKGVNMEKERKIAVNVSLPDWFVDKLDLNRGNTPRSEFIRDFLLENMKLTA